jgi:hypothetical protein
MNTSSPESALRQSPADLRKLILKLRWIGQESEAEALCSRLAKLDPQEIALDLPAHTD